MLDIKRIRENLDDIKKAMDRRGEKEFDLDAVVELDDQRRELLKEVEALKSEMNIEQKKIPQLMKEGKKEEAEAEEEKGNYVTEEEPGKFRRIIASPMPIDIYEIDAVKALLDADQIGNRTARWTQQQTTENRL